MPRARSLLVLGAAALLAGGSFAAVPATAPAHGTLAGGAGLPDPTQPSGGAEIAPELPQLGGADGGATVTDAGTAVSDGEATNGGASDDNGGDVAFASVGDGGANGGGGAAPGMPTDTTPAPPPAAPAVKPMRIASASLSQDGGDLVFSLSTRGGWTPASLLRARRTLCVRLVYDAGSFQSRDVCVDRKGLGMTIARVLQSGHHGPLHFLAGATLSRPSTRSLVARIDPSTIGVPYTSVHWRALSTTDGCIVTDTSPCDAAMPASAATLTLRTPLPIGCTTPKQTYFTNGSRAKKVVALTFDDGPSIYTSQFIDILEREHVPGTFFMIGEQIAPFAAQLRRELADGFMLGDHTWTHADVSAGGSSAAGQISETAAAIRRATGFQPCLFRAPGGAVSSSLFATARGLGFTTIQWDIDPTDWATPGTDAIYDRIMSQVRPGSIVLMHEGGGNRTQTLAALPRVIDTLKARGYSFETDTQLIGSQLRYG